MEGTEKKDAAREPKAGATPADDAPEKPAQPPPPMWMRALLGFAGLALLVGFFLPWVRNPPDQAEGAVTFDSGFSLAFSTTGIEGTPGIAVLIVPILGALLSAIAFMGLRYAAQTAVGVAVGILGYALYVLGSMFVQHTGYGLWVVSIGTFLTLLLGVATWMIARRGADAPPEPEKKAPEPAKK